MNVFPNLPGQTFMVNKGPSWTSTVKKAASGRLVRGSLQSAPIWQFKVAYEYLRDRAPTTSELRNLLAFFNGQQGQFGSFYFLDPYDNAVAGQEVAVADGVSTSYQLSRTVGLGTAYPFVEPVYGVVGVPQVFLNGVQATSAGAGAFGTVSFPTAPAQGQVITWTGQFYFLCHFTQDTLQPAQMVKDLWSLDDGLTFESLIP
jgi:uncharacterized protein (TIGR02217 family)